MDQPDKQNETCDLMEDDCHSEPKLTKAKLYAKFDHLFGEFCDFNISIKSLFQSAEDMNNDQQGCFEPQANSFGDLIEIVAKWIKDVNALYGINM